MSGILFFIFASCHPLRLNALIYNMIRVSFSIGFNFQGHFGEHTSLPKSETKDPWVWCQELFTYKNSTTLKNIKIECDFCY